MVTVILTKYKRPHLLEEQWTSIKNQTVKPHQILVCDNSLQNLGVWSRFSLALNSKTEFVCVIDDDTIPGNRWLENCLNNMEEQEGLYGTCGYIFNSNEKYQDNYRRLGWHNPNEKREQVDYVVHNWFFKKEWLKYMWMEEPVSWENGEDIQFSALCQKYGNINTYVPPHPIKDKSLWGNNIEHATKWGNDKNATHLHEKNHYSLRDSICEAYIKKGWKTINSK